MIIDKIALILVIVGALNWGLVGLFSFDLVAWIFGGQSAIISRIIYTVIALAGSGEAHESAFAMANIKDSGYTSVTFTVAMQKDNSSMITQDETKLMIGADDECVWETTLYKGMEPTTFTVELGEDCDRLMFWLNCGPEDNGSHTYAIYDITLNK